MEDTKDQRTAKDSVSIDADCSTALVERLRLVLEDQVSGPCVDEHTFNQQMNNVGLASQVIRELSEHFGNRRPRLAIDLRALETSLVESRKNLERIRDMRNIMADFWSQ